MKIYEILPGKLYQCGKTNNLSVEEKVKLITDYGITTVVNFWRFEDPDLISSVRYEHCYMPDGKLHCPDELRLLAKKTAEKINAGQVVLSQCYGGRNRSGLFSAMILIQLLGISGKEALTVVQRQRPNSLVNKEFCQFLELE